MKTHDKDGKPLLVPEWPERSWETRTFGNMEVRVVAVESHVTWLTAIFPPVVTNQGQIVLLAL